VLHEDAYETTKETANRIKSDGYVRDPNEGSQEVREQFPWRNRQRTSQFDDVLQSDVALPPLDTANVIAMQPCSLGQFLLREPALVAKLSHRGAESSLYRERGHSPIFGS
jgi:hypothetical protein